MGEPIAEVAPHVAVVGVAEQGGFVAVTPGPERGPRQRDLHAQARSTSTRASNAAWPPENPNASTASSGMTGAPAVRSLRPAHPSRIHTVPDGIRSVTSA